MKLCIAEKPSVAGEIAKIVGANSRRDGFYEGNGYWVSWTFGHLCGLKEPHDYKESDKFWDLYNLPIVPKEFGIKLIANKGVEKQFNTIKKLISECEEIINCGDAGQEGELIQRWVMKHAECKVPVKRLWISSLTEEAIKTGFKKLMDAKDFDSLYNAGECRAISDWLYGINATRLFTMKYGKNKQVFSVGRVQTPTLAMIVQRYHEIANFVPQTYFELKTNYREAIFSYSKGKIDDEKKAKELLEQIKDLPLEIKKVSIKEGKEFSPNLFDLTSLQIEANNKLGLSAENTLGFVQSLYEKKLVTYPRVDTVFLPNDMYPKIKGMMEGLTEYRELVKPILEKKIPKPKKVFNDNKVTDHHAIAPTGVIANNISGLEKEVYDLIALRFIAAFYPECKVSNTTIDAQIGKHDFKATGKQILEPGWRAVLGTEKQREAGDKKETPDDEKVLPHFDEGESGVHQPLVDKKKTSAPKEYTEATLLRAMETAGRAIEDDELKSLMKENGIGRPSTRANIIETLFKRNYIEKKGKKILATEIGIHLISVIHNPTLKSPELTGIWEKKLRQIENNEFSAPQFIKEMEELVHSLVTEVIYDIRPVEAKPIVCPKCKTGKIIKGKTAYGCSEWKGGCTFRIPFDMVSAEADVEKLITEGKVIANNKEVLLSGLLSS